MLSPAEESLSTLPHAPANNDHQHKSLRMFETATQAPGANHEEDDPAWWVVNGQAATLGDRGTGTLRP
jgi:hypothetical protein